MNKHLTLLALALLLCISTSFAQELYSRNGLTITASPVIDMDTEPEFYNVRTVGKDGYTADYKVDGEWEVFQFDRNFDRVEVDKVVIPYDKGDERDYNHVFEFGGRYFQLKGTVDREKKTNVFTQQELSETGDLIGDPVELAHVEGDEFYANPGNSGLTHKVSPDGSKLLVMLKMPEQRVDEGRLFTIYKYFVYDLDMNLLWSKVFEFQHIGGRVIHQTYNITRQFQNDGSMAAWAILDRGRKLEDGVKRFAIRFYHIKGEQVEQTDVDLDDKMDGWTFRYANDRVYLFATYGIEDSEGVRIVSWSSKDNKGSLQYVPWGAEHFVKNQPEKEVKRINSLAAKNKPVFVPKFNFYNVIPTADGGFIVTGQEGFNKSHAVSQFTSYTEYFRTDFHLMGISADCKKTWSQIIPLDQQTQGGDYGCIVKPVGKRVFCFFHDLSDNLVAGISPEDIKKYKGKKDPLGMVVIDTETPDAKLQRTKLFDFARVDGWLLPDQFKTDPDLNTGAIRVKVDKKKAKILWFDFQE